MNLSNNAMNNTIKAANGTKITGTPDHIKSFKAWANWYSARLERINNGSKEDYSGYEQDLFEALGCQVFDL